MKVEGGMEMEMEMEMGDGEMKLGVGDEVDEWAGKVEISRLSLK